MSYTNKSFGSRDSGLCKW